MAVSLHSLTMLTVAGLLAILVYRKLGVGILGKVWINLDLIWIAVLSMAGVVTLGTAAVV